MRLVISFVFLMVLGVQVFASETDPKSVPVYFTPDATEYGIGDDFTVSWTGIQDLVPPGDGLFEGSLQVLFGNKYVKGFYLHVQKNTPITATSANVSVSSQVIKDYLEYCIKNEPTVSKAEFLKTAYIQVVLLKQELGNTAVDVIAVGNSHLFTFVPVEIAIDANPGEALKDASYTLVVNESATPPQGDEEIITSVNWGDGKVTTPTKDVSGLIFKFEHVYAVEGIMTVTVTASIGGVTKKKIFTVNVVAEEINIRQKGKSIHTGEPVMTAKVYTATSKDGWVYTITVPSSAKKQKPPSVYKPVTPAAQ